MASVKNEIKSYFREEITSHAGICIIFSGIIGGLTIADLYLNKGNTNSAVIAFAMTCATLMVIIEP